MKKLIIYIIIGAESLNPSVCIIQIYNSVMIFYLEEISLKNKENQKFMQAKLMTGKDLIMKKYSSRIRRTKNKGIFLASWIDNLKEHDLPYRI